jgi:uncharacterized protein
MPKNTVIRIQDSVHGLMEFREMETVVVEILHTPEIQRLRRIKQLGLVNLVFPGAEHSRFVHSLGAAYLSIKFLKQISDKCYPNYSDYLIPDKSSIRDLAVATLCHDIGHGPLSHMWEREIIGDDFDRNVWAKKLGLNGPVSQKVKWHELIAQCILNWDDGDLHRLLEKHEQGFSDRLRNLLNGEYYIPYFHSLLSGDIDVDRADFIKRDTFQTGVAYGRYDLDWLISTCTLGHNENNLIVGFDEKKGMRVVEQFLIARRALYDTVYFHKTVRCADGMMSLFLKRLKDVLLEKHDAYKDIPQLNIVRRIVNGEIPNIEEISVLDDSLLWSIIYSISKHESIDIVLEDLGQRILYRTLFKAVKASSERINEYLTDGDKKKKIYDAIKPYCLGDPKYYLVVDRVKFEMLSEEEPSYFIDSYDKPKKIRECAQLSHFANENRNEVRLFTLAEAINDVQKLFL